MSRKVALILAVFVCLTSIVAQDKKQDKKKEEPKPKIKVIDRDPSGAKWVNAFEITTSHYILHTDLSQEGGVKLAKTLESFFSFMCEEFKLNPEQAEADKLQFYAFSKVEKYKEVADKVLKKYTGITGVCSNGKVYCYAAGGGFGGLYKTSIHEGVHQVLEKYLNAKCGPSCMHTRPGFWVCEGFACFAGSLKVKDDGSYVIGENNHSALKDNAVQNVDFGRYIPMNQSQFYSGRRDVNYIIGYAISHFLYFYQDANKKYKYRDKFMNYVKFIHEGQGENDSLEKTMGTTLGKLQEEYRQYIKGLAGAK